MENHDPGKGKQGRGPPEKGPCSPQIRNVTEAHLLKVGACDPGEPSGQCDSLDSTVPLPTHTQAHTQTLTIAIRLWRTRRGLFREESLAPSTLD